MNGGENNYKLLLIIKLQVDNINTEEKRKGEKNTYALLSNAAVRNKTVA